MASILVPLLVLAPSCATSNRAVRLEPEGGSPVDYTAESGGQPIEIPEAELRESFREAARAVTVRPDPLTHAEETFGLTEGSATYRYYARSGALVPEALQGLGEVESASERMTREYLGWCGETRFGSGDCLRLLDRARTLTLHGRYVVTLVMSMTASFWPMLDSLRDLADPNAVAVMLASAVCMYLLLLVVPEPISKVIALAITGALIGYMGLTMFWELVHGARAMASSVETATSFGQLQGAARDFGKVLGPQIGQLLILLVSHSLGRGLAAKGTAGPPRFAQAAAQSERLLHVRMAAVGAVRSVSVGAGVVTISLATGAMAVGAPTPTGYTPAPAVKGDPYHPSEVGERQEEWQRGYASTPEQAGAYAPAPKALEAFPDAKQARPKTPVQGGGGLRRRWIDGRGNIFEWDSRHGTVEMYDRAGRHLGEFDPATGAQLKPANPSCRVEP